MCEDNCERKVAPLSPRRTTRNNQIWIFVNSILFSFLDAEIQCGSFGRRRKLLPLAAGEKILIGTAAGAESGHYPSGVGEL